MKYITRIRPDTCGCSINVEWDDAVPAEQRIHTVVATGGDGLPTVHCPLHTAEFGSVWDFTHPAHIRNAKKNIFHGQLLQDNDLAEDVIDDQGNVTRALKKGVKYQWDYDANENLIPSLSGSVVDALTPTVVQTKISTATLGVESSLRTDQANVATLESTIVP